MNQDLPQPVVLARNAMNTRFEIVLHGPTPVALRSAGEEALNEVDRLENLLSLFRPSSEIAHCNARAAREPTKVSPEVFRLLARAKQLSELTDGAFDITIAPLVRCWGFLQGSGRLPSPEAIQQARECVGWALVDLDPVEFTVRYARPGVMIDLGAIGKGYAIEQAAGLLREAGVTSALLHGGTSTVCAIGTPPDADAWMVAIENDPRVGGFSETLPPVPLRDSAMSVSAAWGKWFEAEGQMMGHVIDPREGRPTQRARVALVTGESATDTDALSTALLVLGAEGIARVEACGADLRCWVSDS